MSTEDKIHLSTKTVLHEDDIKHFCEVLGSIKGKPTVSTYCYKKVKQLYLADRENGKFEWIMWNGYSTPCDVSKDFTGTKGFDLHGDVKQTKTVQPYQAVIFKISLLPDANGWSLSTGGSANLHQGKDAYQEAAQADRKMVAAETVKFSEMTGVTAEAINNGLSGTEVEAKCVETKTRFCDPIFPPSIDSVTKRDDEQKITFPTLVWKRPEDNIGEDFCLFDDIGPSDIGQGALGDCWLCCSISSLAEDPHLIERIFVTKAANAQGLYELQLYRNGFPVRILLDDYIPCSAQSGDSIFMHHDSNELWPMLLEKAYAHMCGSYVSLRSGLPFEALSTLTGFPCVQYYGKKFAQMSDDQLWAILVETALQDQVCSCFTPGHDARTESGNTKGSGIVGGHAYSLLDAREYNGLRLLNVRNPWGKFEWAGDWGDHSSLWTPELKEAFGWKDVEDGAFWICLRDFRREFNGVGICYKTDSKQHPWKQFKSKGYCSFDAETADSVLEKQYELVLTEDQADGWIGLLQDFKRYKNAAETVDLGAFILAADGSLAQDIPLKCDATTWHPLKLAAGTYRVVVYSGGVHRRYHQPDLKISFGLSVATADQSATWREIPMTYAEYEAATTGHLFELAEKTGKAQQLGKTDLYMFSLSAPGVSIYTMAAHVKAQSTKSFKATWNIPKATNVGSHRASMNCEVVVHPGETKILHYAGAINSNQGTTYASSMGCITASSADIADEKKRREELAAIRKAREDVYLAALAAEAKRTDQHHADCHAHVAAQAKKRHAITQAKKKPATEQKTTTKPKPKVERKKAQKPPQWFQGAFTTTASKSQYVIKDFNITGTSNQWVPATFSVNDDNSVKVTWKNGKVSTAKLGVCNGQVIFSGATSSKWIKKHTCAQTATFSKLSVDTKVIVKDSEALNHIFEDAHSQWSTGLSKSVHGKTEPRAKHAGQPGVIKSADPRDNTVQVKFNNCASWFTPEMLLMA